MNLNIAAVLSVIFESKKTGKGRLGRGKIFAEMMSIIADCDGSADIAARIAGNIDRFCSEFYGEKLCIRIRCSVSANLRRISETKTGFVIILQR